MRQVFLDVVIMPIFMALYFCTPSFYRAYACWLVSSYQYYRKLFNSCPLAVEWATYKLIDPCFVPMDGRVG